MKKIHVVTPDEIKLVMDGLKLYKKEGKFQYIRKDYLERSIEARQVFMDNDTIAIITQMKRAGRVGEYKYSRGEWHIHPLLSVNKKNVMGPFIFMRRFIDEYVKPGKIFGCIHESNIISVEWHKAFGFKESGKISWLDGTIPGKIFVYDCSDDIDRFIV